MHGFYPEKDLREDSKGWLTCQMIVPDEFIMPGQGIGDWSQ
jgi:hypothetical protein